MRRMSKVLVSVTTAALVASAVVMSSAPAEAEGVGSGRAVIRIDAPTATVTKVGKHAYRMVLPEGATGQWMGERPDARGRQVTRVGDLTAGKLANRWTKFRYAKAPVYTTLMWNSESADPGYALIMLDKPKMTDAGVRFDFTSRAAIPTTMSDVSINISRAPGKGDSMRVLGVQYTVVTGTMVVWINAANPVAPLGRIYDKSGGNCWGGSDGYLLTNSTSVGSGTCAGIAYQDYITSSNPYGFSFTPPPSRVLVSLNVTPPNQASYHYSQTFYW
ncbi:MAG: hypothetical protein ACR2KE_07155 [Candidatus Nanopelagicales bacterium]